MTAAAEHPATPDLEHAHLFTIACAWSARTGVYRPDTYRRHTYDTTVRVPLSSQLATPPSHPWAILTTVGGTSRTILVADFDGTKGGDPIADAHTFSDLLARLGCPHLLTRSSCDKDGVDSGNRHVLALLTTPWEPATSGAVTAWLTATFPTFDAAPMAASPTAAIRFAGSPHRGGGHAELDAIRTLPSTDPAGVLTGSVRAPADLADRIIAVAAAAATGDHSPTMTAAGSITIDDPAVLPLLVRSAAEAIAARTGRLHDADTRSHRHLTIADGNGHRKRYTSPDPTAATDAGAADDGSTSPFRPVASAPNTRDGADQVAVSQWAPRADAATSLPPLSWFRDQWASTRRTAPTAAPEHPAAAAETTLPPHIADLLTTTHDLPSGTASGPEHAVLMSLIAHGYSADDVVALALRTHATAFTHSRRSVVFGRPILRDEASFVAHLRRQYAKAKARVQHLANTHSDADHAHRIDALSALVVGVLAAADEDPHLQFNRFGHLLRRTLEAHILTALAAADSTYHCGSRDLARSAGAKSPQTAATHSRTLVQLGYLTVVEPSQGRAAHRYELHIPSTWTQGNPAPQTAPTRTELGSLLAARCGHFQHDVWLSSTLGDAASLVLLHLAHLETAPSELPAKTGYTAETVASILEKLHAIGLLDSDGNAVVTQAAYDGAAAATGTAGRWSKLLRRWEIDRARWAWWCAEQEFLSAPRTRKHVVLMGSVLAARGRYPRTGDGHGHHRAASLAVAATLPALVEVTR